MLQMSKQGVRGLLFLLCLASFGLVPMAPSSDPLDPFPSLPRSTSVASSSVLIIVKSNSDAINGNCRNVGALLANPGPDGISLREAITASNNTPGEEVIRFDPLMAGKTITVGTTTRQGLPMLLGGGLTIDGDIDGDSQPDVTIDGSLGAVYDGTVGNAFSIWSSGNVIQHLRFTEFHTTIQFAVPHPAAGYPKTISSNQILNNVIEASHSTDLISVGPLGLAPVDKPETISNLTWQDIIIAGNVITSPGGIFLYAGTGFSVNNRIMSVTIRDNHLSGGGGIELIAGDANTAYHKLPPPIRYADYNSITDVLIEGNVLDGPTYDGIALMAGNDGNRYNRVERVRIIGNSIRGGMTGINITAADDGGPEARTTRYNQVSQVEVRQNRIEGLWWGGILVQVVGGTDNAVQDLVIADNVVQQVSPSGLTVYGGALPSGRTLSANNVVQNIQITGNQVLTQTQGGAVGIELFGGWRSGSAQSGQVTGNRVESVSLRDNRVSGFDTGLVLVGGDGLQVTGNSISGTGCGSFQSLVQSDNRNGAQGNTLDWQWCTPTPTNTSSPTATATPTDTLTPTATSTSTPTATATPTDTLTPTATSTSTPTATATPTDTPTPCVAYLPLITKQATR